MRPLFCLILALAGPVLLSAGQFELLEASGIVCGRVEVERGRLMVYQTDGARTYFSRQSRYDSPDGRYLGFFNPELNRVLRFPRSGNGYLQSADLDDLSPRFRNARYAVRPSRAIASPGLFPPLLHGPIMRGYPDWRFVVPPPQSVLIDARTVPNPPLTAVQVEFRNDGPRELQVGVIDLKDPSGSRSARIAPAAGVAFELQRDSGAKRVAHYRVMTPLGEQLTQEFVSEVPPDDRYEVVVHEWAVQSVAIDRTGKSPDAIEDIQFQGRGIGRFRLPPGPQLQSGTIDVYRAATSQGNQGTIAPITPANDRQGDALTPLDRAILEAQRAAQSR